MKLTEGKAVLLFRFHNNPDIARERLRILRYYNPNLQIHALFGGKAELYEEAKSAVDDIVASTWLYPEGKEEEWKWRHTDLMLKAWYCSAGQYIDFDFLYSYEYDLLTLAPLSEIYPNIDDQTLALAACEPFTEVIEKRWIWTSTDQERPKFLKFCKYLQEHYGIKRQKYVCLGPGPLLPKKFLDSWSKTEDIDLVHDELTYPAFAEALGFKTTNHGMHPGFGKDESLTKYFNCNRKNVTKDMIKEQLSLDGGRRTFHPVKMMITLEEVLSGDKT